jgi:hypothetical protein
VKTPGWFVPAALAGAMAYAAACSSGDSAGPKAGSVTGIFGNNDSVLTGGTLLVGFTVLGADGFPLRGAQVTWNVSPALAASVNPASQTSDSAGAIATHVTVGTTVGAFTVTASVNGVAPIDFHLKALDPCKYVAPLALGDTVHGVLATTDCLNGSWYDDFYSLSLPAGPQSIRISMRSSDTTFDPWVDLYYGTGRLVAFDDDSILGVQRNSQLDIIFPGGTYVIGANAFRAFTVGPYTLTAQLRPAMMSGCRQVWVARGVSVNDSVTLSDCADSTTPTHHYYDVARIFAFSGTVLTMALRSTVINPTLALYRVYPDNAYARRLLISNDDSSAGNTNAFIRFVVDTTSAYDVILSTSAPGQTGAYTFSVDSSTTLSGVAPALSQPSREWWRLHAGEVQRRSKP